MILFHATISSRVDSILRQGLLTNPGRRNYDFSNSVICLTDDPIIAQSFVEGANNITEEEHHNESIVVLSVDSTMLDHQKLFDDKNISQDEGDIVYLEYRDDIPPSAIQEEFEVGF
jgi:hypothetical protein